MAEHDQTQKKKSKPRRKKSKEDVVHPTPGEGPTKNVGGRPTKYTEDMPEKLINYFNIPSKIIKQKEIIGKNGIEIVNEEVANVWPTVWGFCCSIDIHDDTFYEWVKRYPRFSGAYKKAKMHQRRILFENGLTGDYATTFGIFVSKAVCKIREDVVEDEDPVTVNVQAVNKDAD